jgi:geranylgeranyl diphosphate synthase type II
MGATIAKAPKNDIKNLYEVGRLAGIAFQIQDDLLDSFGDPAKFGKQVGGDILQNKKTFLVIELLRTAPESAKNKLKKCMQMPPTSEKIEAVKSLFRENGVIEMTEKKKKQFSDAAFEKLEKISVEKNKKIVLEKTLTDLLNRDF